MLLGQVFFGLAKIIFWIRNVTTDMM